MRRWMFLLALATVFAGCSARYGGSEAPPVGEARVDHKRAAGVAYEHEVAIEVPVGQTRPVSEGLRQACAALPERSCTLLESTISSGDDARATIKMRVVPEGVNTVLRSLDGRGKILAQSSKGEDLAEPIEDGERRRAMLLGYRDQLQTLARQRALDAEALIKLHRELAEVQSEIEKAANAQAQLRRRVDTELLTVAMQEQPESRRFGRVTGALEDFGEDLLRGVAGLITFVASTIPFALFATVAYMVWRRVRARRRKAERESEKC